MPPNKADKPSKSGVSDAELLVLKELWEAGPASPSELRQQLALKGTKWAYTTVQTLLHRLFDKGAVVRNKQGVAQVYRAQKDVDGFLVEQVADISERLGAQPASPLVMNLVRGKDLTKGDLSKLRAMLDEAEANAGKLPQD